MSGKQLARFVWGLVATGCFDNDLKLRDAVARRFAGAAAATSVLGPPSPTRSIMVGGLGKAVCLDHNPGMMRTATERRYLAEAAEVPTSVEGTFRSSVADNNDGAAASTTHGSFQRGAATDTRDMVFLAWALSRLRNSPPLLGRQRLEGQGWAWPAASAPAAGPAESPLPPPPPSRSLAQHQRSVAEAAAQALAHVYAEVEARGLGALNDQDVAALLFAFCGGSPPGVMAGSGVGSIGPEDVFGSGAEPRSGSRSIAGSSSAVPPESLLAEARERHRRGISSRSRDCGEGGPQPRGLGRAGGGGAEAPAASRGASGQAAGGLAPAGVSDCLQWATGIFKQ